MVTPKALGEFVGTVKDVRRDALRVTGTAAFANGDGLCFLKDRTETAAEELLEGFRVNRVEGNWLYPSTCRMTSGAACRSTVTTTWRSRRR